MTNEIHDDIRDAELRAAIAALPREIAPERDLWNGIAERIAPRRRRLQPWPVAAAVVGLIALGAIAAALTLHYQKAQTAFVVQPSVSPSLSAAPSPNPRAQIVAATIRRATRLDPKTQAVLLKNLGIIETSIANIERALNENPNAVGLQPLLYQLYRDEAALVTAAQRVQLQTTTGAIAL